MSASFSIYLEIIRIFATLLVFIAHSFSLCTIFSNVEPGIGRNGVIFFFVLSGYVISWCANEKESRLIQFVTNRAARIYSVALPAILLAFTVSVILYKTSHTDFPYQFQKPWIYLPIYLSFTGDFWNLSETPPNNFPYWSLDYEVWYYVIFSIFFYFTGKLRIVLIAFIALITGPYIISMFPLWMSGSLIYFFGKNLIMSRQKANLLVITSIAFYFFSTIFRIDSYLNNYNYFFNIPSIHWIQNNFLGDYFIGIIIVANLLGASKMDFNPNKTTSTAIRTAASYSFSCYLFHIPILSLIKNCIGKSNSIIVYLLELTTIIVFIVFLAKFTEHKKGWYRSKINKLFAHIGPQS